MNTWKHLLTIYLRVVERLLRDPSPLARAHVESQTRFLRALVEAQHG